MPPWPERLARRPFRRGRTPIRGPCTAEVVMCSGWRGPAVLMPSGGRISRLASARGDRDRRELRVADAGRTGEPARARTRAHSHQGLGFDTGPRWRRSWPSDHTQILVLLKIADDSAISARKPGRDRLGDSRPAPSGCSTSSAIAPVMAAGFWHLSGAMVRGTTMWRRLFRPSMRRSR